MALPYEIKNGDIPDAEKLMANLEYLNSAIATGSGIITGAYSFLKSHAAASPTEPFDCWATDTKQRLFYCGDTSQGDEGFIVLGGAAINTTEEG